MEYATHSIGQAFQGVNFVHFRLPAIASRLGEAGGDERDKKQSAFGGTGDK